MVDKAFAAEMMEGYNHLSIPDLLAAREQYHVFLTKHPNVVATAIGRYLIRKSDKKAGAHGNRNRRQKPRRTLANSAVDLEKSWPCVLVFVDKWQTEAELLKSESPGAIVPKTLYLADGRAVPVCLVEAPRVLDSGDEPTPPSIRFPRSVIAGGFPLIVDVQGRRHIATVGCLVTDGSKYYGLTSRHVTGEPGRPISAELAGGVQQIGVAAAANLQLAKLPFGEVYPGWPGQHLFVNADVGLIDIDNLNQWRTDVFGIGALGQMADLNANSLTLGVIGAEVTGFGAVSGRIDGIVSGLFYRYRSVGGMEYVSDFLIGPAAEQSRVVHHGDSGAVLLLKQPTGLRPFAITWGAHDFADADGKGSLGFALATGLGNVRRILDVDLVRGWNLDQPYTWGKTGHFKIGFRAADLVSNKKLAKLLSANQVSLGYSDQKLLDGNVVAGTFTHDFVPLADVADIIWRTTRPNDESNHFSDIDETHPQVHGGKSLLELSLADDDNIDLDVWLDFDQRMDAVKPNFKRNKQTGVLEPDPREGALPFRVWQMYQQMIRSLSNGKLDEFLVAGGTMAHYVGDACQPLHISFLHHGADPSESGVHSDYETALIDKKQEDLFKGVNAIKTKVAAAELIGPEGKAAAKRVLELMKEISDRLSPTDILNVWRREKGRGKYDRMWTALGPKTILNIAAGSHVMAILWQSAWKHGGGDSIALTKLGKIQPGKLQTLYSRKTFVQSFHLADIENYRQALLP